jgi:hypothetical protein
MPMDPRQAEVWALFGWLVGVGQLIEDHLRTILASGPDPVVRTAAEFEAMIDQLDREKATMGRLITRLEELGADPRLISQLRDDVLPDRNVLVHRYIVKMGAALGSPEGRAAIVDELRPVAAEFEEVQRALAAVIRDYVHRLGWSDADIWNKAVEATRWERDRLRIASARPEPAPGSEVTEGQGG